MQTKIGVLLINLGTPSAPTSKAVRSYLKEFLSDPRVVNFKPRWLWQLILNCIILTVRPKKSAKNYEEIWLPEGSPLLVYSQKLQQSLQASLSDQCEVALAMCYQTPSVPDEIDKLLDKGIDKLLILPMYPQYCTATTKAALDAVHRHLAKKTRPPKQRIIIDYHQDHAYIDALAQSIKNSWTTKAQPEMLVISFHGTPTKLTDDGDPYYQQCQATASLLADKLALKAHQWKLVFQSRFGPNQWLQPFCDDTLVELAKSGVKSVNVICPGFSVDCLETIEEINMTNQSLFLENGGKSFHYIPALNETQTALYQALIERYCLDWA